MNTPSFVRITLTATSDLPIKPAFKDKWLYYADIFCLDNDCYMGDSVQQDIPILTNDIYTFPNPVNINDLFFSNLTAGSNSRILIVGLEMTDQDIQIMKTKGTFLNH